MIVCQLEWSCIAAHAAMLQWGLTPAGPQGAALAAAMHSGCAAVALAQLVPECSDACLPAGFELEYKC